MLGPLKSLQQLESLVKAASETIQQLASQNRALIEKLEKIESEHKRVKEELREAKLTLNRHERLRARLLKLSDKLERIG
jgi:predicted transcriptional regulator